LQALKRLNEVADDHGFGLFGHCFRALFPRLAFVG
jgi:hypothetical protein